MEIYSLLNLCVLFHQRVVVYLRCRVFNLDVNLDIDNSPTKKSLSLLGTDLIKREGISLDSAT